MSGCQRSEALVEASGEAVIAKCFVSRDGECGRIIQFTYLYKVGKLNDGSLEMLDESTKKELLNLAI